MGTIISPTVKTITTMATPSPGKKIMHTTDGRVISVQTLSSMRAPNAVGNATIYPMTGSLPKVHLAPHGPNKVIRLQTVPNPRMILPRGPRPLVQTSSVPTMTTTTFRYNNQTIQISPTIDGNIQVKGLIEGQQMIQRGDGKLHLVHNGVHVFSIVNKNSPTVSGNTVQVTQQKPQILKTIQHPQQIVKVNGQSVLLRKDGLNAQIVSVGAGEAIKSGVLAVNNQQQGTPKIVTLSNNSPQVKTIMASDGTMVKTVVGNIIGGGAGTQSTSSTVIGTTSSVIAGNSPAVNKVEGSTAGTSSLTLRVQVRMTEQGPKTIIQGLQPSVGLTKDHIRAIQQQVRSLLAQYNLKVNQLSPIMTLTLHIANQAQTQLQQHVSTINTVPAIQQQQVIKQQIPTSPTKSVVQPPVLKLPTVIAVKNNNTINVSTATAVSTGGNTFIRTATGTRISAVTNSGAPRVLGDVTPVKDTAKTTSGKPQQFELTNDYIQQTIQSTLSRNDLSPDVEEKLVKFKKFKTEQSHLPAVVSPTNNKRQRETVSNFKAVANLHQLLMSRHSCYECVPGCNY